MTDEVLAGLAQSNDREAEDILIRRYVELIRGKAHLYFIVGADSEDVIQEGMIGLFKAVRDYRSGNEASFATFANLCINRQILTAVKSATRKKHIPLNSYVSLSKSVYEDGTETTLEDVLTDNFEKSPEDIFINKEKYSKTEQLIFSSLSKFETAVLMHYLCGKSYSDIAAALGKSEKSIDNALQRIKKKIEKNIADSE